jgi:hypothetical protein
MREICSSLREICVDCALKTICLDCDDNLFSFRLNICNGCRLELVATCDECRTGNYLVCGECGEMIHCECVDEDQEVLEASGIWMCENCAVIWDWEWEGGLDQVIVESR